MGLKSFVLIAFLALSIRLLIRHRYFLSQIFPRILQLTPAITGLIVIVFYGWTAFTSRHLSEVGSTPYSDLAQAFRHGHLNIQTLPSDKLLSLSDPYDPVLNAPYRYHDMSLYNGKYYLYFGPLPAIFLFLPVQLMGLQMTGYIACFILGTLLLLTQTFIVIKSIGHEVFRHPVLLSGTIMLLGFGSTTPILLRRPAIYEIAILSAAFFLSCSILCLVLFLRSDISGFKWGCSSIIFTFFAFSSRPSQLIPVFMISFLFIVVFAQNLRQRAAYLGVAISLVLLICSYNYFRFESIFEFGNHFQLAGVDTRSFPTFELGWIKPKIIGDLLTIPEFSSTFPWLKLGIPIYATALGPTGLEPSIGLLIYAPWLIPVFTLFILRIRKIFNADRGLFTTTVFTGISASGSFAAQMVVMPGLTYRYLGDYAPFIFLAAAMFIFSTYLNSPTQKWYFPIISLICLFGTVATVGLLSFIGYYNPLGY